MKKEIRWTAAASCTVQLLNASHGRFYTQSITCASVARPRRCVILSYIAIQRSWMAGCPDLTLQMMMQSSGWKTSKRTYIWKKTWLILTNNVSKTINIEHQQDTKPKNITNERYHPGFVAIIRPGNEVVSSYQCQVNMGRRESQLCMSPDTYTRD